jgi:SAM-dependent methyltransferase
MIQAHWKPMKPPGNLSQSSARWRGGADGVLTANAPSRLCPHCGTSERIGADEAVWPEGWNCPACGRSIEIRDAVPIFAPTLADTVSGMNPASFESLARWETDNFWFVPRNRLITALLARYFPAAQSFMEIGCGNGFVLSAIAGMKPWRCLVGSELHLAGLAFARDRLGARAQFVQMDARAIPAVDVFDAIGAFDVLEHIEEDEAVLAAMHQALRPQGGLLLAVPQHPWLWSNMDEYALHVRRYRRGELEQKVRKAGFRVLWSASYTSLLLPVMAASRLARANSPAESISNEFELPKVANAVLKSVLQFEVTLTLAGLRWPAGGSRIVVAVKRD